MSIRFVIAKISFSSNLLFSIFMVSGMVGQPQYDKGPHPLLWADSRTARGKIRVSCKTSSYYYSPPPPSPPPPPPPPPPSSSSSLLLLFLLVLQLFLGFRFLN